MKKTVVLLYLILGINSLEAQSLPKPELDPPLTRILFVFDASQSMYGRWQSGSKIDVAQRLMSQMLDSLARIENKPFQLALRVYGHQKPVPPQDCDDTKLEVGFKDNNIGQIKKTIRSIQPKGTTPIARSLMRAATDFPTCSNCRNIIILITDGIESCDEDPCAASRLLQKKGIILKPFVIGIGLDKNFQKSFSCVGQFYDAADEKTFKKVLDIVISQALDNTTAQVNLLDLQNRPSETDVAMTFYSRTSGKAIYNYIHTLNYQGNPDTLVLDPLIPYRLVIHTIPPVTIDSVSLAAGRHNHIGTIAARGTLEIKQPSSRANKEIDCIIRRKKTREILHVQELNTRQKYLVGEYDIEILTLPRYTQSVTIDQVKTTIIAIPPSGKVSFQAGSTGYGSVFQEIDNELSWVTDLDENQSRQSFDLQPGNYRVIFRPKSGKSTLFSISRAFSINSGESVIIKLK
jgi:Ca-activated chloride channel homolog